jgi:hypothetical protein
MSALGRHIVVTFPLDIGMGVLFLPWNLYQSISVPWYLWIGIGLDPEYCCTMSGGSHGNDAFGLLFGGHLVGLLLALLVFGVLRTKPRPVATTVLTAVLYMALIGILTAGDAFARSVHCPPLCT